jgi:hypothetical protein
MTRICPLFLLLLLLLFASSLKSEENAAAPRPLDYVSKPIVLLRIGNFPTFFLSLRDVGLGRMFREPAVKKCLEAIYTQFVVGIPDAEPDPWSFYTLLLGSLGGEVCVSFEDAAKDIPVLIVSAECKGDAGEFYKGLTGKLDALGIGGQEETLGGKKLRSFPTIKAHLFSDGRCIVFTIGADPGKVMMTPGSTARFALTDRCRGLDGLTKVNSASCYVELSPMLNRVSWLCNGLWADFAFGGNSYMCSSVAIEKDFAETVRIASDAPKAPLTEAAAGGNHDLSFISPEATVFVSGRFNWSLLYMRAIEFAEQIEKIYELGSFFEALVSTQEDLGEDIEAAAGTQAVMQAVFRPNGLFPDIEGFLETRDDDAAVSVLESINESSPHLLRCGEFRGRDYYWADFDDAMIGLGIMPDKGRLLLANGPLGIKNLAGREVGATCIADNPIFKELSAEFPRDDSLGFFINLKKGGERLLLALQTMRLIDFGSREGQRLPYWAELEPYFSGVYAGGRPRDGAFEIRGKGDLPVVTFLAIALMADSAYSGLRQVIRREEQERQAHPPLPEQIPEN